MPLHDQPILDTHASAFHDHVPGEALCVLLRGLALQGALEDAIRLLLAQPLRVRGQGRVIGRPGSQGLELLTAHFQGPNETAVIVHIHPAQLAQQVNVLLPSGSVHVNDIVRAERGEHAAGPTGLANGFVVFQGRCGHIRCAQDLDVKTFEKTSWSVFGLGQFGLDVVVNRLGRLPV